MSSFTLDSVATNNVVPYVVFFIARLLHKLGDYKKLHSFVILLVHVLEWNGFLTDGRGNIHKRIYFHSIGFSTTTHAGRIPLWDQTVE